MSSVSAAEAPVDVLAAVVDRELPGWLGAWGEDRGFDARLDWQRRLAAHGWAAPGWPVEFGGRGLSVTDRVACDLLFARRRTPTVAGILGVNNVGPTLIAWGNEAQQASLPRILDGTEMWCQGFSEPDAGSDLASLRTTAVTDGDDLVINGQKVWTSQGMQATHCQLLVRTAPELPRHRGISALAIPLDLPGIERRPLRQLTGECDFAELFFRDVRVPRSALLGPINAGWTVTMTTLAHERAGVIALAGAVLTEAELLVADHQVGGAGELSPVLADEVVERYVEAKVLSLMGARSLADAEAGGSPGPEQSIIKLSWSLLSQALSSTRLAVDGLAALTGEGTASGRGYLQARASTIAGGTTEVMKNILAERVLRMPKGA